MKSKNLLTHLKIFTEIDFFVLNLTQDIKLHCNICIRERTVDVFMCACIYICIHRKRLTICDMKMIANKIPQLQANSRKNHIALHIQICNHKSMGKNVEAFSWNKPPKVIWSSISSPSLKVRWSFKN